MTSEYDISTKDELIEYCVQKTMCHKLLDVVIEHAIQKEIKSLIQDQVRNGEVFDGLEINWGNISKEMGKELDGVVGMRNIVESITPSIANQVIDRTRYRVRITQGNHSGLSEKYSHGGRKFEYLVD